MSNSTSVVIPYATLLKADLFAPVIPKFKAGDPRAKPEYSVWGAFDAKAIDAVREKVLACVGLASSRGYQMPFRDGDAIDETTGERKSPEYLRGKFHFTAATGFDLGPKGVLIGAERKPAAPDQVYSGVIGAVLCTPKLWEYQGKKGIKLYLNAVLITAKGTRMSIGGVDADTAFGATEISFGELPTGDDAFSETPF